MFTSVSPPKEFEADVSDEEAGKDDLELTQTSADTAARSPRSPRGSRGPSKSEAPESQATDRPGEGFKGNSVPPAAGFGLGHSSSRLAPLREPQKVISCLSCV